MNYYSAESVIAELKANNTLICEGVDDIGCPSPAPFSNAHEGRECKIKDGKPCVDCSNQSCYQWIVIRKDEYIKLGMLMFMFAFSSHPLGRIPQDDSLLKRFTKHKLVDENRLKSC